MDSKGQRTLSDEQYSLLYKTSFISLFSALYALYKNHYSVAFVPGCIFLTSINYWKNPTLRKKYIDITCVKIMITYQIIRAYKSENYYPYYTVLFIGISCYPLALYFSSKKMYWYSVYAHSMMHVIGNISHIILYSGYITKKHIQ